MRNMATNEERNGKITKIIRDCFLIIVISLTLLFTIVEFVLKKEYQWIDVLFNQTIPVMFNFTKKFQ